MITLGTLRIRLNGESSFREYFFPFTYLTTQPYDAIERIIVSRRVADSINLLKAKLIDPGGDRLDKMATRLHGCSPRFNATHRLKLF